jgi:phenylacetate-coenzyme A ligase PaaK-like adenylate-forming protein
MARDRMTTSGRAVSYWFDEASGLRLAESLDVLSRDEIESLRRANFLATVEAARSEPAVRERRPELADVAELDDLRLLPLLTPAELADECPPHSTAFLVDDGAGGLVVRSSGTAGKTKMMFHSWQSEWQVNHLGARGVHACLRETPRRIANCMTPGELNGAFLFVHGLSRYLRALTFSLGSSTPVAESADMIAEHGIDTLVAAPAYGTELITSAPAEQLGSLRTYMYLGEGIGRARRNAIREAAPILDVRSLSYSTNETGPIGYQCRHVDDNTHHVHEDGVVVEVVDGETGERVPDGTDGEVAVTTLADAGMILFRYRIGDRGRIGTEPCPCGSAARLLTLAGRTSQSLNVDVWVISSDQLMSGLAELGVDDPADCQLQVHWDVERYRLRLLLSPRTPDGITPEKVVAAVRAKYQLHKVMTNRRCTSFTVERVEPTHFARTSAGKVPVLYETGAEL